MSHKRMKLPEALRSAYCAARRAGWDITRTGGGHLKRQPPAGRFVITPATPSGGCRSLDNALQDLRRAGLPC